MWCHNDGTPTNLRENATEWELFAGAGSRIRKPDDEAQNLSVNFLSSNAFGIHKQEGGRGGGGGEGEGGLPPRGNEVDFQMTTVASQCRSGIINWQVSESLFSSSSSQLPPPPGFAVHSEAMIIAQGQSERNSFLSSKLNGFELSRSDHAGLFSFSDGSFNSARDSAQSGPLRDDYLAYGGGMLYDELTRTVNPFDTGNMVAPVLSEPMGDRRWK